MSNRQDRTERDKRPRRPDLDSWTRIIVGTAAILTAAANLIDVLLKLFKSLG